MIGLPLRLLAREVYDRITVRIGEDRVALLTGEEKRVPKRPDYWVCTVEAMPTDLDVDFVAVDEIQLAAHNQRGHVFTDRLLHARGRKETWLMGADTMRSLLEDLVPAAQVTRHPRLSRLTCAGSVPLGRVAPRSAVVAFSMAQVYALAERLRAIRGGTAVVLGGLSPRTRNAQVAMFQSGEVDWLVATDAIGMGLNLDVRHVAFAALRKFDGRDVRSLDAAELGQIAGRAGRYIQDGTFGSVAPLVLPTELVTAVEAQVFSPVRQVYWRRHDLEFTSLAALTACLRTPPRMACLRRIPSAEDEAALAALVQRPEVLARTGSSDAIRLLWDVCTVPDFRKLLFEDHVLFLGTLYDALTSGSGRLSEDWLAAHVDPLDDPEGDVDTLVARIASVRTWTYVANQSRWLDRAAHWQERTRAVEDRLSDALHVRLVARFVEGAAAPARPLATRRARTRRAPQEATDCPPGHPFAALRALRDTMATRAPETPRTGARAWIDALVEAPHARFSLDLAGRIRDGERILAELVPGPSVTLPGVRLVDIEDAGAGAHARILRRLVAWTRDAVGALLAPLRPPGDASPALRGLLYRLEHGLGTTETGPEDTATTGDGALTLDNRAWLASRGVRVGLCLAFAPALLRPEATAVRSTLAAVHWGTPRSFGPPVPGAVSLLPVRGVPRVAYTALGYPVFGPRAVRADVVERVAAEILRPDGDPTRAARWLGCPAREAAAVIAALRCQHGGVHEAATPEVLTDASGTRSGTVG